MVKNLIELRESDINLKVDLDKLINEYELLNDEYYKREK